MIYVFGEYELDTDLYELRRSGTRIPVEPQVYDVLCYLVRNRDRVVTKEELLESVWGDHFVSESALTTRLMAARKAIGDSGREQHLIRTQHGRGYRFIALVEERPERLPSPVSMAAGAVVPRADRPGPPVERELPAHDSTAVPRTQAYGREAELDVLRRSLDRALNGSRQIVFVSGDAGLGKTTVVETFLSGIAGSDSIWIGRGQCLEQRGTGEPYMPVLEALGRMCRGPGGDEIVRSLAAYAPTWLLQMPWLIDVELLASLQSRVAGATSQRMLRELGEAMEALAAQRPVVLVLEDLHWSDYSTVDLLAWLGRRVDRSSLLVLCTYRPVDVRAHDHPLRATRQELRVRGQCQEIELPLLSRDAVEAYLRDRLESMGSIEDLARLLMQRTDGNPLFVQTLLDSWIAEGQIEASDGRWTLTKDVSELADGIPRTLREVIDQHIDQLQPEQQEILEAASVAGVEFSSASTAAALELPDDDVEAQCSALSRMGRLLRSVGTSEWPDGTIAARFEFLHALYKDVLYDRVPAGRRARLHQRIAVRLERAYQGQAVQPASELAVHFTRGRVAEKAVRYHRLAAQHALERSAHREAIDHLTSAVDQLQALPPNDEHVQLEIDVQLSLGWAHMIARGWAAPQVAETHNRALALSRTFDYPSQMSAALYGLAAAHEYRGEYRAAQALLEEQLRRGNREWLPESHEVLACSNFHQGRFDEALRVAEAGLTHCQTEQRHAALLRYGEYLDVSLQDWAALALWFLGYPDQALARANEALRLARGHACSRVSASVHLALISQHRAEPDHTRKWAEATIVDALDQGLAYRLAQGRILRGWALAAQGESSEGLEQLREGLAAYQAMGARVGLPYYHTLLGDALRRTGDIDQAQAVFGDALAMLPDDHPFFYEAEIHRQRGVLLRQRSTADLTTEAIECFRRAAGAARRLGAVSLELRALTDLVALDPHSREQLSAVVARFTEGFETPDLQRARAVLNEVSLVS